MASTLSPSEEAQLAQTIEMFEVITQSQPQDYQSLEILKEAYSKLGRDQDVVGTSRRIAQAYVQMGQLSSAILEYETILQRCPNDPDVQAALSQIESRANNFPLEATPTEAPTLKMPGRVEQAPKMAGRIALQDIEDGRRMMHKIFVESKMITAGDFDLCWSTPDPVAPPGGVQEPFIQVLADKGILPVEKSMHMVCDKSRAAFLPLKSYDIDMDLSRTFPAATCQRWCVLPFDRMSKSVFVATANPFNQQAAKELAEATANRLIWYIVSPTELVANLRKAFR
jgi:hypothetical protein